MSKETPMTAETKATEATPKALRRKRASTGGFSLKLEAPARPGYVRRFFNDDPVRIQQAHDLGYDFVTMPGGGETRDSRFAGKNDSGAPHRTILMETPEKEYALGLEDKESRLKPFDDAINRGADPTGSLSREDTMLEGKPYEPGRSFINNSSG